MPGRYSHPGSQGPRLHVYVLHAPAPPAAAAPCCYSQAVLLLLQLLLLVHVHLWVRILHAHGYCPRPHVVLPGMCGG